MKKQVKSNPLKTFNDNTAKAKIKAGGTMKSFKKTLPKAQLGQYAGPSALSEREKLIKESQVDQETLKKYKPWEPKAKLKSISPVYLEPPKREVGSRNNTSWGPDFEGPYSILGSAGPVNESVSKTRDNLRDAFSKPKRATPYLKKGGVIKSKKK